MASSRASAVASIIASDNVGCGCIECNISLYVVSKSLASDISEIKSVALAPIIWQPVSYTHLTLPTTPYV